MAKKKKKDDTITYGGQAVIEGVMMRGPKMYAVAVRNTQKEIEILKENVRPASEKYPFLKWPVFRGVVSFISSLATGMQITMKSAEIAGLDAEESTEEQPSKFEQFLTRTFGEKLNNMIITFSVVLAVVFSILLFMLTPTWLASLVSGLIGGNTAILGVLEGLIRIALLVCYMLLISLMKDIKRVYQYHGAEHKTINCYESGEPLTVENVGKHTRLHKRCGTSFMLFVMFVSMVVFFFVRTDVIWMRFAARVALVPLIAGLSYEIIRWAGRSKSPLVALVSYPGLCLQRLTTAEPDDGQIEVAIAALREVLDHEEVSRHEPE